MLTSMSLLDELVVRGYFIPWELPGRALPERLFYHTGKWTAAYKQLQSRKDRRGIELASTEKGKVSGLLNDYVRGEPRSLMIRPRGSAMSPPVKRLDPPREVVAELRVDGVRIFGFFRRPNAFFALDMLKKETRSASYDPYDVAANLVLRMVARLGSADTDQKTDDTNLITP